MSHFLTAYSGHVYSYSSHLYKKVEAGSDQLILTHRFYSIFAAYLKNASHINRTKQDHRMSRLQNQDKTGITLCLRTKCSLDKPSKEVAIGQQNMPTTSTQLGSTTYFPLKMISGNTLVLSISTSKLSFL